MKSLQRGIEVICQVVMWITVVIIFFILCGNTVLRYSLGTSLQWGSELPELLFPWLVMSGVVLGASHGSHITTTFLMDAVPAALRRVVGVVVWLTVAVLYGTLTGATWAMLDIVHDEKSPILQVPGSVTYCLLYTSRSSNSGNTTRSGHSGVP